MSKIVHVLKKGDKFTIQHAMSCKKGSFVNLRHKTKYETLLLTSTQRSLQRC